MNAHNALGALFIAAGAVCLPLINHHDAPPAPPSHSHLWSEQAPAADVHLDVPDPLAAAEADAAAQHAYVRLPKVELPSANAGGSVTVPKAPAAEKAPKAAKQSAKAKAPKSAKSSSAKAPKAQKQPAQPKGPTTTVTDKTVTGPKGTTTTHTVTTRGPAGTVGSAGSTKSS